MNGEAQRLMEAIKFFEARTKGGDIPKPILEAIKGLSDALGQPIPSKDTPGQREVLKMTPGTDGTGEHFSKAAIGRDGPSPGQKEAESMSAQIAKAAAEIAHSGGPAAPTEGR